MSDIVERLRSESFTNGDTDIRWEAADEIERLRAERAAVPEGAMNAARRIIARHGGTHIFDGDANKVARALLLQRKEVLEEAARTVEALAVTGNDRQGVMAWILMRDTCAAAIRALKAEGSNPSSPSSEAASTPLPSPPVKT